MLIIIILIIIIIIYLETLFHVFSIIINTPIPISFLLSCLSHFSSLLSFFIMKIETVSFTRVASRTSVLFDAPGDDDDLRKVSEEVCSTTSSSSIGRNSDDDVSSERSMDEIENGENEAESKFNGGALNSMETLEEVLPIRRGISNFYNGKSKSFTSLADVVTTPSVKDIVKPENAYTRRRRNLMAFNHVWDNKNKNYPLRSNGGGISKRTMSLSRSALALAVALSNSDSSSSFTSEDSTSSSSNSSSPSSSLPPLHPRNRVSSLSSPLQRNFFSLADLHHCAIAATMKMSSSSIENESAHPS